MRGFAGPLSTYFHTDLLWTSTTDSWVQAFVDLFIQGKLITLFAFLFGVGFAVQFARAEKRHSKFAGTYVRRLLALLAIQWRSMFGHLPTFLIQQCITATKY
jgi:uncharacterized membrane protein YeiB